MEEGIGFLEMLFLNTELCWNLKDLKKIKKLPFN
jgi:hypothetical protein